MGKEGFDAAAKIWQFRILLNANGPLKTYDTKIESFGTKNAEIPKFYLHGMVESEAFTLNFWFRKSVE